ncbi:SURF1 family protein [uncultured Cohaesibacter sp.]|uniref:SURF1 family protein n=1 Tax=uncultured Cohaesibacter sp. TaxID=1002546 RepID=UPI0029C5FD5D|nr:SURF1 family protein [uncultured Cohaesibacter sp.]
MEKVIFRAKFWLFSLCALVVLAILISLGNWQMRRLAWKEQLIADVTSRVAARPIAAPGPRQWADLAADEAVYRPVYLTGHYDHAREVHVWFALSNPQGGALSGPGYMIMTPFITKEGWQVIVNRGFVPEALKQQSKRPETLSDNERTLDGLMRFDEPKNWLSPKADKEKNVWIVRQVSEMAAYLGMDPANTAPYWVDLVKGQGVDWNGMASALPQGGETRISFRNSHLQYALTWYGLAVVLVIIFMLFLRKNLSTPRQREQDSSLCDK